MLPVSVSGIGKIGLLKPEVAAIGVAIVLVVRASGIGIIGPLKPEVVAIDVAMELFMRDALRDQTWPAALALGATKDEAARV